MSSPSKISVNLGNWSQNLQGKNPFPKQNPLHTTGSDISETSKTEAKNENKLKSVQDDPQVFFPTLGNRQPSNYPFFYSSKIKVVSCSLEKVRDLGSRPGAPGTAKVGRPWPERRQCHVNVRTEKDNWLSDVCQQKDWRIRLRGSWPQWERLKILTSGLPKGTAWQSPKWSPTVHQSPPPPPASAPSPGFLVYSLWSHFYTGRSHYKGSEPEESI